MAHRNPEAMQATRTSAEDPLLDQIDTKTAGHSGQKTKKETECKQKSIHPAKINSETST